jgi:hypothetical protein
MVEFLMAIVPVLLTFLGAVQLLLLGADRVVVAHAAVAAARSAAVVLDDDPAVYGGEAVGHLGRPRESARVPVVAETGPLSGISPTLAILARARTRFDVIYRAANAPLAAMGPSPTELTRWFAATGEGDVAAAINGSPLARTFAGSSFYDRAALALRISELGEASAELVRARVTYLAHCAVPLVSALICRRLPELLESDATSRRALDEVPEPGLTRALGVTGERFVVMVAEASFPRQGARYLGLSGG